MFEWTAACCVGQGLTVSVPHNLIVVSNFTTYALDVHSLTNGALLHSIPLRVAGERVTSLLYGGLCTSADGDRVLVAEFEADRVREVHLPTRCPVRVIGAQVLSKPMFVDCNAAHIVVSEAFSRVTVLAWHDGSVLARFGDVCGADNSIQSLRGIRLLADGTGVIVADLGSHRVCVFTLTGELVTATAASTQLLFPSAVVESPSDACVVVACYTKPLLKVSLSHGSVVDTFGRHGSARCEFNYPCAMAALPEGGLLVREHDSKRLQMFHGLVLRMAWIAVCAQVC